MGNRLSSGCVTEFLELPVIKEELQVEAAWGRRAGWTQTTQPRGDAMPGARLLLAGPQGEARRGGLFRKESTKVGLTHWAEIGEC